MESLLSKNLQGTSADLILPFPHQIRILDVGFDHFEGLLLRMKKNDRSFFYVK
jgi:hypothetical protein